MVKKKKMSTTQTLVPQVSLIIGPMFSGKTSELIRLLNRYKISQKTCVILKKNGDIRHKEREGSLGTHSGIDNECVRVHKDLMRSVDLAAQYDVIGVDDGQFFENLVSFCEHMANVHRKVVIVSALDGNAHRNPYTDVCLLVAKADDVKKLTAICTQCNSEAAFSARIDGLSVSGIDVGGADKYTALCRRCHTKSN